MTRAPALADRHVMGQSPTDLDEGIWLIDDPGLIAAEVERRNLPLTGAFIPVCLHDPGLAEGAYDSAEWAAELLASLGRCYFVLTPFVARGAGPATEDASTVLLDPPWWNHAVAMADRLRAMVAREGLYFHLTETLNGLDQSPGRFDPAADIQYVLDTAGLGSRGWSPRRLAPSEPTLGR